MSGQMPAAKAKRLFVSYGVDDAKFAKHLLTRLKHEGFDTLDAASSLRPGDKWGDTILKALRSADRIVFVVPSREGGGKNALAELGAARAMGKEIIAVIPDSSRAWNSDVARAISDNVIVDASRVDENGLIDALAS